MEKISANGVEFAYLSEGQGPLVLLTHGFPDTPHTWDAVLPALAAAGYRAVAPFLRGYHPSGPAPDGRYDAEVLGKDVLALITALGERSAIVVGHDYGAAASYSAAMLDPERVRLLVVLAIPHPASVKPNLVLLWRLRHFIRFKMPGAARALRKNDFAMVDELVHRWSPAWQVPPEETRAVKTSFAQPGCAEIAVEYYKQIPLRLPAWTRADIRVPTVAFAGETDGVLRDLEVWERARRRFSAGYEVIRMPGGHFLHREHPQRFNEELLAALKRHTGV